MIGLVTASAVRIEKCTTGSNIKAQTKGRRERKRKGKEEDCARLLSGSNMLEPTSLCWHATCEGFDTITCKPYEGRVHYAMVSKIQWKPFWLTPALSTKWLDWVAKWCERWHIRTGAIRQTVGMFVYLCDPVWRSLSARNLELQVKPPCACVVFVLFACTYVCGIWSYRVNTPVSVWRLFNSLARTCVCLFDYLLA